MENPGPGAYENILQIETDKAKINKNGRPSASFKSTTVRA